MDCCVMFLPRLSLKNHIPTYVNVCDMNMNVLRFWEGKQISKVGQISRDISLGDFF